MHRWCCIYCSAISNNAYIFQIPLEMTALATKIHAVTNPATFGVVANQIYTYTKRALKENTPTGYNCAENVELTQFGTCLVSILSANANDRCSSIKDENETYVNCELNDNKLILSKASKNDIEKCFLKGEEDMKRKTAGALKIRHFELCPAKHMSNSQRDLIPQSVKERNIGVAVAVLLGKFCYYQYTLFYNGGHIYFTI